MIIHSIKNFNENLENCVLTFGHFNTIHPGHIRYLKYAKEKGDILAVALKGDFEDKNSKTFKKYEFSQLERAEALELLSISDYIFCLESDDRCNC